MPNSDQYLDRAKSLALKHYNSRLPQGISKLKDENVYIVWFTKTLQNWKALVSTDVDGDSTYYEITHNGSKKETYIDCYTKVDNVTVSYADSDFVAPYLTN